jgi:serine/threonine protein kinase
MVVGPYSKFCNVIAVIDHVQKLLSNSVIWNKQQCNRIVSRYSVIADILKRMVHDGNSIVGESSDVWSTSIEEAADILLHEARKVENFISDYGEPQGITNVVCRTNNPEAFENLHEDLDTAMTKLGLIGMGDVTELPSKMNMLKVDAEVDKKEIRERFSRMVESAQRTSMNHDVVKKLAQVVLEKSVEDNAGDSPSYLNIAQTEIIIDEPVRLDMRKSNQDPKHEEVWEGARKGKWLDCDFAIKVFNCGGNDAHRAIWNQRRLFKEATSLVELQHPHVVRLVGFGQFDKQSVFVMELMDTDLRSFMETTPKLAKPFTDSEELEVITQIAKGMHFIHTQGYMHGALKCSNILVKSYGQYLEVKIGDLQGSQKRGRWNPEAFERASKIRRPRWTAPEALDYGRWTTFNAPALAWNMLKQFDIYSFAMTCYEIVTGKYPFHEIRGDTLEQLIKKGERPELPEALDEHLKGLITSCWDEDPKKRPNFESICHLLNFIKLKTNVFKKDHLSGIPGMVGFLLNQWKNTFKHTELDQGNEQPEFDSALIAHENLRIPKYFTIEPEKLTRGELIGRGPDWTVCKTTWLGCTFVEKVVGVHTISLNVLQAKVKSLKVISHPCIVQMVGLSENSDETSSIIMECMDGDLQNLIDTRMGRREGAQKPQKRPFDLHEQVFIILQIALGMAHLHSQGFVHGDLKPVNVLTQEHFGVTNVKVAGLIWAHLNLRNLETIGGYYTGWGTAFYRAPEMSPIDCSHSEDFAELGLPDKSLEPDFQALQATDVFSFAMTCYHVITGNAPNSDLRLREYAKVRSQGYRPKWPTNSDLEPMWLQLKSLVERCWVLIPKERPTFDDICKELLKIHSSLQGLDIHQHKVTAEKPSGELSNSPSIRK